MVDLSKTRLNAMMLVNLASRVSLLEWELRGNESRLTTQIRKLDPNSDDQSFEQHSLDSIKICDSILKDLTRILHIAEQTDREATFNIRCLLAELISGFTSCVGAARELNDEGQFQAASECCAMQFREAKHNFFRELRRSFYYLQTLGKDRMALAGSQLKLDAIHPTVDRSREKTFADKVNPLKNRAGRLGRYLSNCGDTVVSFEDLKDASDPLAEGKLVFKKNGVSDDNVAKAIRELNNATKGSGIVWEPHDKGGYAVKKIEIL